NIVQANFIGSDASSGTDLGNSGPGIFITEAAGNLIGGTAAGAGNVIAFNANGVVIVTGTGNAILSNSIRSNGGLGIDLDADGVTTNDPTDTDAGANQLQNYPVLGLVTGTSVHGTLRSTPSTEFRIELFVNGECDSTGHGEGAEYLGSARVITDSAG